MQEIGQILAKILEPQLSRLEPPVVEVLTPLWTRVVGAALALKSRPAKFSAGTLTLTVEDGDWAEPLRQMAEEIRTHVNNFLGKPVVKRLKISRLNKASTAPLWGTKHLNVAQPGRSGWLGQARSTPSGMAPGMGRSHTKYSGRNRGGVS